MVIFNSYFAIIVTDCSFLYKVIKLHIGRAKFSAIHPIQKVQLSTITDLMAFAYSRKCISITLRAHTCKHQAAETYKQEILGMGKLLDLFSF